MQRLIVDKNNFAVLLNKMRRYQLALACLVIVICFALGNDVYKAKALVLKNKDLFPAHKKVVNYTEALNAKIFTSLVHSDLTPLYLIKPKQAKQKSLLKMFAGGNTCGAAATPILVLPYSDPAGTTVGKVDDYKLPPDTTAPTVTGCPTCTATGTGTAASLPRGAVYTGTGTGTDSAYKVTFNAPNANMLVTMTPAAGLDLALIVYTSVCSNNLTDGIAVSDRGAAGAAENITITTMPVGVYNIVVDGYSYQGAPPGPSGTYTLAVSCVAGQNCIQPIAPTAAGIEVSGRVLSSAEGRGLRNALVTMTDQSGQSRTALTGSNGNYTFADVEAGGTYVVSVRSRRFSFSPRVLQITDNIADLDFVPEQ